jgi:hypothetical protein
MKAPKNGFPFRLYIVAKDKVIGVVLTQESEEKEHTITYLSWRLVNYVYVCSMHAPSLDMRAATCF